MKGEGKDPVGGESELSSAVDFLHRERPDFVAHEEERGELRRNREMRLFDPGGERSAQHNVARIDEPGRHEDDEERGRGAPERDRGEFASAREVEARHQRHADAGEPVLGALRAEKASGMMPARSGSVVRMPRRSPSAKVSSAVLSIVCEVWVMFFGE